MIRIRLASIQLRIALWASACLIVSGMVIVAYAVVTSRATALRAAEERSLAEARTQAGIVKAEIEVALDTARARAHELAAVRQPENPLVISREQVNTMMRQVLLQNPQYVGVWTLWEPNAFDGLDAQYAGTEAYGETGRFFPYWNRGTGTITVEPIVHFDTGDWYQVPKTTGREYVSDIYLYPVMGVDTWMISVVAPIVVGNVFYGVAGEDISITFLQELTDRLNIYSGTGKLLLIGHNGRVVAATGREAWRGRPLAEAFDPQVAEAHLQATQAGREHIEQAADRLQAAVPIYFGRIEKPWTALITVPSEIITAPANSLMWRLIATSMAMILAGVAALVLVARQIAQPVHRVAEVVRNIAAGDLSQTVSVGERTDELGMLAQDFNHMTRQLRGLYADLAQRVEELHGKSQELSRSERKFRVIFDETFQLVGLLDVDGRIIEANKTSLQFIGREPADIIGRPFWETEWWAHSPALQEQVTASVRQAAGGEFVRFEATHIDTRGNERRIDYSIKPVRDEDGRVVLLIPEGRDITEYKKLECQLRQAQKMEAIGTLAGGIAHDFNNILGVILGNAEMARDDCRTADQAELLDDVIKASYRARELVKQILAFSRQMEAERRPLQPASIVKEVMKMLRPSLPSTIFIEQHIASSGLILADPTHIHQILLNLCTNAFQAMETTGGRIVISLREVELSAADLQREPDVRPGRFVRLTVEDSGPGMAPEVQEKIFDPYFTTKEVGKGTGMGLSIVHGIVKSYGGFIALTSDLGKGTVFNIHFPAVEAGDPVEENGCQPVPGGTERVLLVDDEQMLLEMTTRMLERLGYEVIATRSSAMALEQFASMPDRFDIVITDQTMPGLTGLDMVQKMLEIRPRLAVILCTGYSSLLSEEKVEAAGVRGFLLKPLTQRKLAQKIRDLLDMPREGSPAAAEAQD